MSHKLEVTITGKSYAFDHHDTMPINRRGPLLSALAGVIIMVAVIVIFTVVL